MKIPLKAKEHKNQSKGSKLYQRKDKVTTNLQFVDNRPGTVAQRKRQAIANSSSNVVQLKQLQQMANHSATHSDATPIQLKGKNKRSSWNAKQIAQNERLFARRAERQTRYAEARQRARVAIKSGMKPKQLTAFDGLHPAIQMVMRNIYNTGFTQQNSAPRAVFNRAGDFARCKAEATRVLGRLGPNRATGVMPPNTPVAGQARERYMIKYHGVNVQVRNFSSNSSVLGTIEFQKGCIFEFKYL